MQRVYRAAGVRLGLGISALALATAAGVSPANAEPPPVLYDCQYTVAGASTSEGFAYASFDTPLGEDEVFELGDSVSVSPVTGTVTFHGLDDALREAGVAQVSGEGYSAVGTTADLEDVDFMFELSLSYEPTSVPQTGPLVLQIEGNGGPREMVEVGVYDLGIWSFDLALSPAEEGEPASAGVNCWHPSIFEGNDQTLPEGFLFDTFTVIDPAATSPATPTPSDTPVRPVLVQTDFAEDDAGAAPLFGVGALMTLAAGAVCLVRARMRATVRQH